MHNYLNLSEIRSTYGKYNFCHIVSQEHCQHGWPQSPGYQNYSSESLCACLYTALCNNVFLVLSLEITH